MTDDFFRTLRMQAEADRDVYLVIADPGFSSFDEFRAKCPCQFVDIGVAGANMIGVAAGLALSGKNVYCYSAVPFLTMRAYEQIRVDLARHSLNVKLVGAGGGFTCAHEGFSRFGVEDLALMRSLPHFTIMVPADGFEAECVARISYEYRKPMYIRLGGTNDPLIHDRLPDFRFGKAMYLREGDDVAIFAIGSMVYVGTRAVRRLADEGIEATLINVHTLCPVDRATIHKVSSTHKVIYSLEEHNMDGGLGSAIAEVLAETGYAGIFRRIGIPENFRHFIGDANCLRGQCGLTAEAVAETVSKELRFAQALQEITAKRRARTWKRVLSLQLD